MLLRMEGPRGFLGIGGMFPFDLFRLVLIPSLSKRSDGGADLTKCV